MAYNSRGEVGIKSMISGVTRIRLLISVFNKVVTTTGIKLIVHRTTEDAARRRENVQIRREDVEIKEGQVRRGRLSYTI